MTAPATPFPDRVTTWICAECQPEGVPAQDPPAASFSLPCCICGVLHRPPMIRRVAVVDLMGAEYRRGYDTGYGEGSANVSRMFDPPLDAGEEADTVP